jgi:hypothetical protein
MVQFSNSVANFNNMQPGQQFTGTWTLRNTGSTAWPGSLQVVYVEPARPIRKRPFPNPMGAPATTTLQEMTGRDQAIHPGSTVQIRFDLVAPTLPGAYAFHWQLRDKNGRIRSHTHWLKIGVVAPREEISAPTPRPPADTRTQFGMNVNINPGGHPLDAERMAGLGWVRFVFWASRESNSPRRSLPAALPPHHPELRQRRYPLPHHPAPGHLLGQRPLEQRPVGILRRGSLAKSAAAWPASAPNLAIWSPTRFTTSRTANLATTPAISTRRPSASPRPYALILRRPPAIRQAHPGAKMIFGGLKTGPHNAAEYARQVQRALGGNRCRWTPWRPSLRPLRQNIFFNFGSIGRLPDALNVFKQAFPNIPLWITEVGVAADSHIGPEHYQSIATYMREVTSTN